MYGSWDMKRGRQEFFVILDHFLPFYPTNKPKNQKFEKMKKSLEISLFYTYVPKIMIRCTVPEIWCGTDGRMDGKKKWYIEVSAPPKKWQKATKNP